MSAGLEAKKAITLAMEAPRMRRLLVRDAYGSEPCVYCGGPAETIDHVLSASRGGGDGLSNLVPSCARCNNAKRDMIPQDFFSENRAAAWRFAERAVHANPVFRALAARYSRRSEQPPGAALGAEPTGGGAP